MRNVVVGASGAPEAEAALVFAVDEALRRRLPLLVVHAYPVPSYGDVPAALFPGQIRQRRESGLREANAALARARERVPGGATVQATVMVLEGDPTPCLLSVADSAALLVVGSGGEGSLTRALKGSVAASCLHRSLAPVAVVPNDVPAVPDRWLRSRVVVGLDGSPSSLTALSWGVAQAREWGAPLMPVVVSDRQDRPPVDLRPDLTAQVWAQVMDAGGSDLEVHPRFLHGEAKDRLVQVLEPADLLVLGSRGLGGLAGALRGATSSPVALSAPCTTVVVREGQARREIHQRRAQPLLH